MTRTPQIIHPLVDGSAPDWASGWGQDEFGIFADLRLTIGDEFVDQRLRWIPSGMFTMGEGETAHRVELTHSFWIFDTPCTQALWQLVMNTNPSRFVDLDRPVDSVSWDDTQSFFRTLKSKTSIEMRLLTEAEWEYCCRAGTTDATYAGDIEILGFNNAPDVDPIAWYGGNSGAEFDLDNGADASWVTEKQYDFKTAGSRKVGQKRPNQWGLYDTLGNVLEWCQDWHGSYRANAGSEKILTNPIGPPTGDLRVLRGGSWFYNARFVRSAYRDAFTPDYRNYDVGFRCAFVQASG